MHNFEWFLSHYKNSILKACWKYVHQESDVRDLFQESVLRMSEKFSTFSQERAFPPWAHQIVKTTYLRKFRDAKRIECDHDVASYEGYADNKYLVEESVLKLLELLPIEDALLIQSSVVDNISQADIAAKLKVSQQEVSRRIRSAICRLKELYLEFFGHKSHHQEGIA